MHYKIRSVFFFFGLVLVTGSGLNLRKLYVNNLNYISSWSERQPSKKLEEINKRSLFFYHLHPFSNNTLLQQPSENRIRMWSADNEKKLMKFEIFTWIWLHWKGTKRIRFQISLTNYFAVGFFENKYWSVFFFFFLSKEYLLILSIPKKNQIRHILDAEFIDVHSGTNIKFLTVFDTNLFGLISFLSDAINRFFNVWKNCHTAVKLTSEHKLLTS